MGDDAAGADYAAIADGDPRQDNGTMTDPDIMADDATGGAPPVKKGQVIIAKVILGAAVGKMMLGDTAHWVIAGVDAYLGGN